VDLICRAVRKPPKVLPDIRFRSSISTCFLEVSESEPEAHDTCEISLGFCLLDEPIVELATSCWQQLFRSSYIVEVDQLSLTRPSQAKGLEVSFDLMMTLAAIESVVEIHGGIVFVGYHTVLFAEEVQESWAQFHLETEKEAQINPFAFKYGKNATTADYTKYKSLRCFLGWCGVAQIYLGTKELKADVRYSDARKKKTSLQRSG
jgi:hypothetical protein